MDIQKKTNKKTITHIRTSGPGLSVLFSKGRRAEAFFTEDSGLYITPRQSKLIEKGITLQHGPRRWDSLSSRVVKKYQAYRPSQTDALYQLLLKRCELLYSDACQASRSFVGQFSMAQLWNMSIVGAILVGMVSMTMIYRFLGPGASADTPLDTSTVATTTQTQAVTTPAPADSVLGADTAGNTPVSVATESDFDKKVKDMVKGYPIEDMLPYILDKNQSVAAFMIAIAKQESGWGEHVPLLDGQDCYNYWGYREQRQLLGSGGHTCFNSRKDAVDTVAKRIKTLIGEGYNTPEKMILWKCGDSCVGDASEQRWISTVGSVYSELTAK